MIYDLEERTQKFGENVIEFAKELPKNVVTNPIINQLVKAGTSVGANYCEANGASSKRDFRNKIFICKKEAQETKHRFRMIARAVPEIREKAKKLWKETHELVLIFSKIISSTNKN